MGVINERNVRLVSKFLPSSGHMVWVGPSMWYILYLFFYFSERKLPPLYCYINLEMILKKKEEIKKNPTHKTVKIFMAVSTNGLQKSYTHSFLQKHYLKMVSIVVRKYVLCVL